MRPYSWINLLLLATLAVHFAVSGSLALGLALGLILWFLLILILEYVHKDEGRPRIPILFPVILLVVSAFVISDNLMALLLLVSFVLVSIAYAQKKKRYFGLISFIIRGMQQVLLFLTVFFFAGEKLESVPILFIGIVFSFTAARNLIADFRDINVDKVTLPIVAGMTFSKIIAATLLIAAGYLSFLHIPQIALLVPLVLLIFLLFFYNSVKLHRIAVILTTAYFSAYLAFVTNNLWWLLLIGVDIITSILFYKKIYRPTNILL